jgi:hypothetical protein
MGTNLGAVRLHTDTTADRVATSHRANAVTMGRDVFFAAGRFRPETPMGFGLLVHELTHVRQLSAGSIPRGPVGQLGPTHQNTLESEARTHERAAMLGLPLPVLRTSVVSRDAQLMPPATTPAVLSPLPRTGPGDRLAGGEGSPVSTPASPDLFRPLPMAFTAPPAAHPPALRQEIGTAVMPASAEMPAAESPGATSSSSAAADPDALAEQVYARIERRLRLEHERGGTRRWR